MRSAFGFCARAGINYRQNDDVTVWRFINEPIMILENDVALHHHNDAAEQPRQQRISKVQSPDLSDGTS